MGKLQWFLLKNDRAQHFSCSVQPSLMSWNNTGSTVTCLAKKMWSSLESCTIDPAGSSPGCHLKRKINPWTGLKQNTHSKLSVYLEEARMKTKSSPGEQASVLQILKVLGLHTPDLLNLRSSATWQRQINTASNCNLDSQWLFGKKTCRPITNTNWDKSLIRTRNANKLSRFVCLLAPLCLNAE